MDGTFAKVAIGGKCYMSYTVHPSSQCFNKLNIFILVRADLYNEIKLQQWAILSNTWTGFRGNPGPPSREIFCNYQDVQQLSGGTQLEVGGYEKQPGDKYYDNSEPSLNLEFKYISKELSIIHHQDGLVRRFPKEAYILNAHVKQVEHPRVFY